jgi:hypothetical protein
VAPERDTTFDAAGWRKWLKNAKGDSQRRKRESLYAGEPSLETKAEVKRPLQYPT